LPLLIYNMPYIQQTERQRYDDKINEVVELLITKFPADNGKNYSEGDLNYIVSSIVWKLFEAKKSYSNANTLMGTLECIKQEFYRRQVAPYEDIKIKENGNICSDKKKRSI